MLSEFGLISLYSIKLNHNYSMKEFCSHQFQWLAKIRKKLARFRFNVRDIVKKVCRYELKSYFLIRFKKCFVVF